MRRGGSVSFVVEVKRRRFPQQRATTSDLDRGSASRISPIAVGASWVAPLIESKEGQRSDHRSSEDCRQAVLQ
jgi:hypothetical protein